MRTIVMFLLFLAIISSGYSNTVAQEIILETAGEYLIKSQNRVPEKILILEKLIKEALGNNPFLKAKKFNYETRMSRIPSAGAWADPKVTAGIMNLPLSDTGFDTEAMTSKQFGLMQRIPFPGITSLKERIAAGNAAISSENIVNYRKSLIREISKTYMDLYLVDKSIQVINISLKLMENISKIAGKKYEVGKGLKQDVLKSQLEESMLRNRLIILDRNRKQILTKLSRLLGRGQNTISGKTEDYKYNELNIDQKKLIKISFKHNPEIKAMELAVKRSGDNILLARKKSLPFFEAGAVYSQRNNRRDFISAQVSVNIPVWKNRKQDKQIEESISVKSEAEYLLENKKNEIIEKINISILKLSEIKERIKLLKEVIIPQSKQIIASSVSDYKVNKSDFLSLLNSQISLYKYELDLYGLKAGYRKSLADLEFYSGRPVHENFERKIK